MIFQRTRSLIGEKALEKLFDSHVLIFGIGGVGSYALEALVRAGVGNISVVDSDVIDITNLNRQLLATTDTIGAYKVDVAEKRMMSIVPDLTFHKFCKRATPDNISEFFVENKYDYVIDAIDTVSSKIAIIKYCVSSSIPIISSMGTGNKLDPCLLHISDISKTSVCPLAKVIRKELKKIGIDHVPVVFSDETPKKFENNDPTDNSKIIGSISFVPSVAGLMIASKVARDIIGVLSSQKEKK